MHEPHTTPCNGNPKGSDMNNATETTKSERSETSPRKQNSWFELPAPIRRLFDTFPLITYDENVLPQRVNIQRSRTTLHVFTLANNPSRTDLTLNPACLKWQAYLLVNRIPFSLVSANNHASPSGSLPFVLPASRMKKDPQPQAIVSSKIYKWALSQGVDEDSRDLRLDAYMALIDVHIRNAWLYCLYLQDDNFQAVAKNLYIQPASTNSFVQLSLTYQLKSAARDEIIRSRAFVDGQEILDLAAKAFESLSDLLGEEQFYSRSHRPGLFDLALFSYLHPLLALEQPGLDAAGGGETYLLQWHDQSLLKILQKWRNLLKHHERILKLCLKT